MQPNRIHHQFNGLGKEPLERWNFTSILSLGPLRRIHFHFAKYSSLLIQCSSLRGPLPYCSALLSFNYPVIQLPEEASSLLVSSSKEACSLIFPRPVLIVQLLTGGFTFNYPVIQLPGDAFSLLVSSSQEVLALIIQLYSSLGRPLPYCTAPIRRF